MLDREMYVWAELLGREDPKVQSLIWAARDPKMKESVRSMLLNMVLEKGWDPDDPPKFHLPRDISPTDYVVGTAVSGDVLGEDVGPSEADLDSHIGIFGQTATGKTTLVKLLLLAFTEKERAVSEVKRRFFVWDKHGEYRDLLTLYEPEKLIWLTADELFVNPFEIPIGADGKPAMPVAKWIGHIREWLRLLWLNEPSINLFCEVLLDEYLKRGVFGGNDE